MHQRKVSEARLKRICLGLMVFSLLVFAVGTVIDVGIVNTPDETTDSLGRKMGFNDPLSLEHYGIIVRNFSVANLLRSEGWLEWLMFAGMVLGVGLELSEWRKVRSVFLTTQLLWIPLGLLGFLALADVSALLLCGKALDRETFTDIGVGWNVLTAAPFWVAACLVGLLREVRARERI